MSRMYITIEGTLDGEMDFQLEDGTRFLRVDREDVIILLCTLQGKKVKSEIPKEDKEQKTDWLIDRLQTLKTQLAC